MTDAERLENIRRVVRATDSYLTKNRKQHNSMDFWRGYNKGMTNLLNHIIEELNKEEDE